MFHSNKYFQTKSCHFTNWQIRENRNNIYMTLLFKNHPKTYALQRLTGF